MQRGKYMRACAEDRRLYMWLLGCFNRRNIDQAKNRCPGCNSCFNKGNIQQWTDAIANSLECNGCFSYSKQRARRLH